MIYHIWNLKVATFYTNNSTTRKFHSKISPRDHKIWINIPLEDTNDIFKQIMCSVCPFGTPAITEYGTPYQDCFVLYECTWARRICFLHTCAQIIMFYWPCYLVYIKIINTKWALHSTNLNALWTAIVLGFILKWAGLIIPF